MVKRCPELIMRRPRVIKRSPVEAQEVGQVTLEWLRVVQEWFKSYTGVIQRFPGSALEFSEVL